MNQTQVSTVWLVVSGFSLYYALDSWIVGQGGSAIFGSGLIVQGPVPIALMAILFVSATSLMASLVGLLHARRSGSADWCQRIPLIGFSSLDMTDRVARWFQGTMLVIMSALPLASFIHFWPIILRAKIMSTDNSGREIASIWDFSELKSLNDPARLCSIYNPVVPATPTAVQKPAECLGNATVFPGLEPTVFALLTCAALLAAAVFWRSVFRKP